MTIFHELRKEHDLVRRLLAAISRTQQISRRELLFRELVQRWEEHVAVEQALLYESLAGSRIADEVSRGISEQRQMHIQLDELVALGPSDSGWLRRFEKFKAGLLNHMGQEERGFFQHAGKLLGDAEKARLLEAYFARPGRLDPRRVEDRRVAGQS